MGCVIVVCAPPHTHSHNSLSLSLYLCDTPIHTHTHTYTHALFLSQAFTNEAYEKQRFQDAVRAYQGYSVTTQASLSLLNGTQQLIVQSCTVGALVLTARRVRVVLLGGVKGYMSMTREG